MNTTLLSILGFIIIMTLILSKIQDEKIKTIGGFFAVVLPKIPLVGIVKAYLESKKTKDEEE
jgi:hypothetical protein